MLLRVAIAGVLCLGLVGCSDRSPPPAQGLPEDPTWTDSLTRVAEAPAPEALPEQMAPLDTLWVGVIRANGSVTPVALYRAGRWSTPWPEPSYEEYDLPPDAEKPDPPPLPSVEVPSSWYVYVDTVDAGEFSVTGTERVDAYCGRAWVQNTGWKQEGEHPRRVVGLVLSRAVGSTSANDTPGLEEYRTRHGLVSNSVEGEAFRSSVHLGSFQADDYWFAGFLEMGYEGEGYEIHRLSAGLEGRVATVRGGGC